MAKLQSAILTVATLLVALALSTLGHDESATFTNYIAYHSGETYVDTGGGQYVAVNLTTKAIAWVFKEPSIQSFVAPAFSDDFIFLLGSKKDSSEILALDRATGRVRWKRPFLEIAHNPSPIVCGNKLLVNDAFRHIEFFLGTGDGQEQWNTESLPFELYHPPAVSDSQAWFVSKKRGADKIYGIVSIDCVKRTIQKTLEVPEQDISRLPVLLYGDKAILAADHVERSATSIAMVDLATGRKVWDAHPDYDIGRLAVVDDKLLFGGAGGVWGLYLDSGKVFFQHGPRHGEASTFCVFGNAIIYQDGPNTLRAIDKKTDKVLWTSSMPSSIRSNLISCGDYVCAKLGSNTLAVLEPKSGKAIDVIPLKGAEVSH